MQNIGKQNFELSLFQYYFGRRIFQNIWIWLVFIFEYLNYLFIVIYKVFKIMISSQNPYIFPVVFKSFDLHNQREVWNSLKHSTLQNVKMLGESSCILSKSLCMNEPFLQIFTMHQLFTGLYHMLFEDHLFLLHVLPMLYFPSAFPLLSYLPLYFSSYVLFLFLSLHCSDLLSCAFLLTCLFLSNSLPPLHLSQV